MNLKRLPAALLLSLFALPTWCAKLPIVESDLLKIKKVTEVQITPDGAFAAFAVLSVNTDSANSEPTHPDADSSARSANTPAASGDPTYTYRSHLWLADLRTTGVKPIQITTGDRNDTGLAISPDGTQLAFVRADAKKHSQIWLMPLRTPGEPRMLTALEYGAVAPRWRKDGRALLVSSAIPISKLPGKPTFNQERPGRDWWDYDRPASQTQSKSDAKGTIDASSGSPDGDLRSIRDWLEHNSAHNDPSDLTRMAFLGELSLAGEMTFSELFRIDLSLEPKATQLTSSYRDHNDAVYSPDGTRILFAGLPPSSEHPDRLREKSIIWETSADGSNEHQLVMQEGYSFRNPQFTPDGKHLVLTGVKNDQPMYRQAMLATCDANGANLHWLTKDGEPAVGEAELSEDGHIYYSVEFHGGEPLRRVDLRTGKGEDLIDGPVGVNAFAVASGKLVFAQISAENPNELYLMSAGAGRPLVKGIARRRLTEINTSWLEEKLVALPEEHWITRPDGLKVQYWVMKPTARAGVTSAASAKHPWVLDIHGGPSAMWGPGEFSMWHEFQIFCSFGYGVMYSNPRGSAGYGYSFQRANYRDWGEGPMGDVMGIVDDTIAHYPAVDKDQLFVTGGSYAGYLTAWIVGHTDRFKAAVALRGVYDLSTFFGEGNAYQLVPGEFGGYPWEPDVRKILDQQSPITHVSDINTPLLIMHGSSDNRTGIVQGQMLFRALKQLNRPVEYVRYPGAGHELTRSGPPQQRMDHMLRIVEFFQRYTRGPLPPLQLKLAQTVSGTQ